MKTKELGTKCRDFVVVVVLVPSGVFLLALQFNTSRKGLSELF